MFKQNSTPRLDGKMNSAMPNRHVEQNYQYIASIQYIHVHKCSGIVITQDHVVIVPACFYNEDEQEGELNLYKVWIPIPYRGRPGKYFKIVDIHINTKVNIRLKRDIGLLLVSHYTKN